MKNSTISKFIKITVIGIANFIGLSILADVIKFFDKNNLIPITNSVLELIQIIFIYTMAFSAVVFFIFWIYSSTPALTDRFSLEVYGKKIKKEYKAKFGHENKKFNQEIDQHILAIITSRRGFARKTNEYWLQSRAGFVGISWKEIEKEEQEVE